MCNTCCNIYRANSLKRAIRRLVEHTETAIDEQNNPSDEKQGDKIPNIAIICDSSPINTMTGKFFTFTQWFAHFSPQTKLLYAII